MTDLMMHKMELLGLVAGYCNKLALSKTVGPDYYEPGMMENLDQYLGEYDEDRKRIMIRCESKGLRYENRTQNLERITVGQSVQILRDHNNVFNSNNFAINSENDASLGYLPAELCNAMGPLYDAGCLEICSAQAAYIEQLAERSRYAKQGVLFVEMVLQLKGI